MALDSHTFDDLLVEVVEEHLAGVRAAFGNLGFELGLEGVELESICCGVRHFW